MISIQLHNPISAESVASSGKTWVRLGFADGSRVTLFTVNAYQAGAIADAINGENAARMEEPGDMPGAPANDDEHAFVSIGDVAARIVGRLQKGGRP